MAIALLRSIVDRQLIIHPFYGFRKHECSGSVLI
jgi:hypothetical protein